MKNSSQSLHPAKLPQLDDGPPSLADVFLVRLSFCILSYSILMAVAFLPARRRLAQFTEADRLNIGRVVEASFSSYSIRS